MKIKSKKVRQLNKVKGYSYFLKNKKRKWSSNKKLNCKQLQQSKQSLEDLWLKVKTCFQESS